MGGDSLRDLLKWSRPQELITLCRLIVMGRPDAKADPHMHDAVLPGLAERVLMIESPMLGLSSSAIAQRVRSPIGAAGKHRPGSGFVGSLPGAFSKATRPLPRRRPRRES